MGTGNDHSWTSVSLFLEVGGAFHGRCNAWGDYVGLRHLAVGLYAEDDLMPFSDEDDWMAGLAADPVIAGGFYDLDKRLVNLLESDGRKLLASFDLEWTPSRGNSVNVSFLLAVSDLPAEPHVGHLLRFTAVLTMTIGETLCAGLCWSPSSDPMTDVLELETTIRGEPI